jgi:hypothetical protein
MSGYMSENMSGTHVRIYVRNISGIYAEYISAYVPGCMSAWFVPGGDRTV